MILQELIPVARRGLEHLKVDSANIDSWLQVIAQRVESGQTGAQWQLDFFDRCNGDVGALVREYRARQQSGEPVHSWSC